MYCGTNKMRKRCWAYGNIEFNFKKIIDFNLVQLISTWAMITFEFIFSMPDIPLLTTITIIQRRRPFRIFDTYDHRGLLTDNSKKIWKYGQKSRARASSFSLTLRHKQFKFASSSCGSWDLVVFFFSLTFSIMK